MKCMILAAGYGKRMMPLTKETPKLLLKIGNETMLDSSSSIVLPQIKEEKVTGEIYSDIWLDVGTKDRLELANKILREEN